MTPAAFAQLPPPGPGLAPASPAAALTPASSPAAAPVPAKNLWTFLCPTEGQKALCKEKLCKTQFGQLLNNTMRPISALTGGLIGPCCDNAINPSDLAKPADSASGAAARIKQAEADAKARRAAVRYLGTVDCHYWPEARDALVNALRADTNECVRWEAAMALGRGCCCNKETVRALSITVSGTDEDGNPTETSERVRAAAAGALDHCLVRLHATLPVGAPPEQAPEQKGGEQLPPPEKLPEVQPGKEAAPPGDTSRGAAAPAASGAVRPVSATSAAPGRLEPATYYQRVNATNWNKIASDAHKALVRGGFAAPEPGEVIAPSAAAATAHTAELRRPTDNGLVEIVRRAFHDQPADSHVVTPPVARRATPPPVLAAPPVFTDRTVYTSPSRPAPRDLVALGPQETIHPIDQAPAPVSTGASLAPKESSDNANTLPSPYHPAPSSTLRETVTLPSAAALSPATDMHGPWKVGFESAQVPAVVETHAEAPAVERPAAPPSAPSATPVTSNPAPEAAPAKPQALPPMQPPGLTEPLPGMQSITPPGPAQPVAQRPLPQVSLASVQVVRSDPAPVRGQGTNDPLQHLLDTLRDGVSPAQREWAATSLAKVDWRGNPQVAEALLQSASSDVAPLVRLSCVRTLLQRGIKTERVLAVVRGLQTDPDPRVRYEVQEALPRLSSGPIVTSSGSAVKP
jgi:hypothetical protein